MDTNQQQTSTNGANGPGGSMSPTHGVLLVILGSMAGLFVLGYITRR